MKRFAAYALVLTLALTAPARAQDESDSGEDAGGLLVNFLQDTLSDENRKVRVSGLEGTFSSRATIEQLTVSDDRGVWLTMKGAVLDWNRLALVRGHFSVNTLGADEIIIERLPGPTTTDTDLPAPEATPFQVPDLPVAIELGEISVGRLELGEPVVGVAAELKVDGTLTLAEGALDTNLSVARLDRPSDTIGLMARFDNATRDIALDLSVNENAGGLISAALKLPGRPPLSLTAAGEGPVSDFTADIALASDGVQRVSGQVRLRADALSDTPDTAGGITFAAGLGGDLTPFLPPEYRAFFGTDTRLVLDGARDGEGRVEIGELSVRSDALSLEGSLAIDAQGAVEMVDFQGGITPPDGNRVLLPMTGPKTTLARAAFTARTDRAQGDGWALQMQAEGLERPGVSVGMTRISGAGSMGGADGSRIEGNVRAVAQGIDLADPAQAAAVGPELSLDGHFAFGNDGVLRLDGFGVNGPDYRATVDGTLRGLDSGLKMQGSISAGAADLSRFSGLAGLDLGGTANAQITGSGTPLSGGFDIVLDARAQDLATGIEKLDPLIAGQSVLHFDAVRDETGMNLRAFRLNGTQLSADAEGRLSSKAGTLRLSAELADLALLIPGLSGPLKLTGQSRRSPEGWGGRLRLVGPQSSHADLTGIIAPDGGAGVRFSAELARLERLVPELTGSVTAKGRARRDPAGIWEIDTNAEGPAGISSHVTGSFDESSGKTDLAAKGQLRLNAANLFISPNSVDGPANFDLTLRGKPSLAALRGTVTTSGTVIAIPSVAQTVENIGATVTIADSRADISMTGGLRAGGNFRVGGAVALSPPFDGRLTADLSNLVLSDNLSYSTSASGQLVYAGPLAGNGDLSGEIRFGRTEINLNTASGAAGAAPIPPMAHQGEPAAVRATRQRAGLIENGNGNGGPVIGLNLRLVNGDRVYARGYGLQAEMGGDILLRGTTAQVEPAGQIELIRGALDLFGRRLKLTHGVIDLQGDLKPYVDFQSSTSTSEGQATIEISGPLDAPEIKVYSEPERPSEEALAMLLFGNRFSELSPLVIAQMAASLARLRSGGGGVSGKVRDATGADTVGVGSDAGGAGLLRGGGYLSENVYTDFSVNTEGETELNLNLDVSDSVTLKGTVDNSGDTALGIFFERDY